MPTRLLLVRHADSHHKHDGVVGGERGDRGLTPLGIRQAGALRARLSGLDPDELAVYSSPLPRAVQTAQIATQGLGLPTALPDPDLGSWAVPPEADGMSTRAFQRQYAAPGGLFHPSETVSESWASLVIRASKALLTLARRHRGQSVLVFTHAEVVKVSFVACGGLPLMLPFELAVPNASITEWTTTHDPAAWPPPPWPWTLVRFGDAGHVVSLTANPT